MTNFLTKKVCLFSSLFPIILFSTQLAFAVPQLYITSVTVDFYEESITIVGHNFDNGDDPSVTLGELGGLPLVGTPSANEIVADFPSGGIPDGDYLMTVSTGNRNKCIDIYNLTVGAVGPTGNQGPEGEAGPQGEAGAVGHTGEQGIPGETGKTGNAGPQGLPGPPGPTASAALYRVSQDHVIPPGMWERTVYCNDLDAHSAISGWFYLGGTGEGDMDEVFVRAVDPRLGGCYFRFYNDAYSTSYTVTLTAICTSN